jgi:hypothetical protein
MRELSLTDSIRKNTWKSMDKKASKKKNILESEIILVNLAFREDQSQPQRKSRVSKKRDEKTELPSCLPVLPPALGPQTPISRQARLG